MSLVVSSIVTGITLRGHHTRIPPCAPAAFLSLYRDIRISLAQSFLIIVFRHTAVSARELQTSTNPESWFGVYFAFFSASLLWWFTGFRLLVRVQRFDLIFDICVITLISATPNHFASLHHWGIVFNSFKTSSLLKI